MPWGGGSAGCVDLLSYRLVYRLSVDGKPSKVSPCWVMLDLARKHINIYMGTQLMWQCALLLCVCMCVCKCVSLCIFLHVCACVCVHVCVLRVVCCVLCFVCGVVRCGWLAAWLAGWAVLGWAGWLAG